LVNACRLTATTHWCESSVGFVNRRPAPGVGPTSHGQRCSPQRRSSLHEPRVEKMKKAPAVALIAAAALTLSACSGGGADGADASEAGPLNIGNFSDVTSWDPATADIGFDGPYLSAIYDPLVRVDGDGEPQPALATDWEF